jgi:hypothetical protein
MASPLWVMTFRTPDGRVLENKGMALPLAAALALVVVSALAFVAWHVFLRAPEPAAVAGITGGTIALEPGGSVFVPQGALPAGTQISAGLTRMPALPDEVKAVAEALRIDAAAQRTRS